jgi:indoleamine 2,3-dioxygenase
MSLLNIYDISSNGFLPGKCISKFPDDLAEYQVLLDKMHQVENFQIYVDSNKLSVPAIDLSKFSLEERKFIYSAISLIINKYIWCNGEHNIPKSIPYFLGKLLVDSAQSIGIVPVITNAAVDLYNWSLINDRKNPIEYEPVEEEKKERGCIINFKNIMINYTMTNTKDEQWFYLIMIAIEFHGKVIIDLIEKINKFIKEKNSGLIRVNLDRLREQIIKIKSVLKRMYEHCRPEVFYNQIRIFLNGFDKKYFPDGLQIDGIDLPEKLYYKGGSAAQSTLIQILDILLHKDEIGCEFSKNFLKEMLDYMPIKHRKYALDLKEYKENYNLHDYIIQFEDDRLIRVYNNVLEELKLFRRTHFQIVRDYVFNFSNTKALGTGGTEAKTFLSNVMNETTISRVPETKILILIWDHFMKNIMIYLALGLLLFLIMLDMIRNR